MVGIAANNNNFFSFGVCCVQRLASPPPPCAPPSPPCPASPGGLCEVTDTRSFLESVIAMTVVYNILIPGTSMQYAWLTCLL